ncbi:MAG: hypothetical protein JWM02_967 [Frankiales bacterium]|nr:hypothetical protein [Frankiales bacterium]
MADNETGVVVTDNKGTRLSFKHVDRYEATNGFLHLLMDQDIVGIYAPGAWQSVISVGLGAEITEAGPVRG